MPEWYEDDPGPPEPDNRPYWMRLGYPNEPTARHALREQKRKADEANMRKHKARMQAEIDRRNKAAGGGHILTASPAPMIRPDKS